jgi:hypothetical protein
MIRIFHCGLMIVIIKELGCFARQKARFTAETQRTQRKTKIYVKRRKTGFTQSHKGHKGKNKEKFNHGNPRTKDAEGIVRRITEERRLRIEELKNLSIEELKN